MKNTKLTVTLHIGDELIESLSPEQCERIAERLSDVMSKYYTLHPEEYRLIQTKG
jgi:hypothetical protein